MSLDPKILELRLLLKDSSVGQVSIAKCAAKLQAFGKNVNDKAALEGFLREILMYQLEYEKTSNSFSALDRQDSEYADLESKIEQDIAAAKANIQQLEEELQQQQTLRTHRIECEHLATEVNKLPSRSTLKRKIDAVNQTLDNTKASIELVENEINTKQSQFINVALAIAELQKKPLIVVEEDNKPAEGEEVDAEEEEGDDSRGARNQERDSENQPEAEVELDEDGNPIATDEAEGDAENEAAEDNKDLEDGEEMNEN